MLGRQHFTLIGAGLLLLALAAGCSAFSGGEAELIKASGVVEVTQVTLASEIGGAVLEVLVQEGDTVNAGQVLVRFDDQMLAAQLTQSKANLTVAQATHAQIVASSELERIAAQQVIDDLYKTVEIARAQAQQEVAAARDALRDAERHVNNLIVGGKANDINAAQANLVLLEDRLEDALEDFDEHAHKPEDNLTRAAMQLILSDAQGKYDEAVRLLNNLESSANDIDLAIAEADLALAEAQLALAELNLEEIRDGPDPDALALAEARLENAGAALPLAAAQVEAAAAAVEVLDAQIEKLVILAPSDGVVLHRLVEPGESIPPGAPVLTISSMEDITITVYIPEDRYGQISLGDPARVSVDSFPNESFEALVKRIADQAEYTPRNVQTEEDRRTTVFAIELSVIDPGGKLKPGMPADVNFTG